jgi:hypothetical protein
MRRKKKVCALRIRNCSNTMRHREVPIRLIFSVARLYMLVIPDYISKSVRSGDARVPLRLVSVCRLFHFHVCILVTSQQSVMLMTLFPPHSRCVRRRHVHIIPSLYPFLFETSLPQTWGTTRLAVWYTRQPGLLLLLHRNRVRSVVYNLQCLSGPFATLPPTSLGSFSVPLKCVLPVPKVHIFIPAFCPSARPWAPGWSFWRYAHFQLFGKMSKAE